MESTLHSQMASNAYLWCFLSLVETMYGMVSRGGGGGGGGGGGRGGDWQNWNNIRHETGKKTLLAIGVSFDIRPNKLLYI